MKRKLLFLFIMILLLTGSLFAQLINGVTYRFNAANTGTIGIVPTQLIGPNADNVASAVTDIGFDFWFAGVKYTQFSVDENGLMKLGSTVIVPEPVNNMASSLNLPKLAAYWDDLATGTNGNVSYYLSTAAAPNRVLYVNWNVTVPKNAAGAANAIIQAQLYEATGNIHFVFGPASYPATNNAGYTIGVGLSATDFATVTVTGNTFATAAYGLPAKNDNTMAPGSGSVKRYQFNTDYTAPTISTQTIPNTFGTANRTLVKTITDQTPYNGTGVPTSGELVPRIYYKKTSDASYVSTPGVMTPGGSGISGTWTFTVDHSLLSNVAGGDQIQYFVIAQDQSLAIGHPNISSYPAGVVATDVNTIITPPSAPSVYTIGSAFSGTVTVGTGGNYATLTGVNGLFEMINAGQLSGNLTVNIISDLTEPGTNALNAWVDGAGGPFNITIQPVGARTISGSNPITLNGAKNVLIDGLNDGSNSLTFNSTGGALSLVGGASNNVITRTTVKGYSSSGGAVILFNNNTATPCSNNTISYSTITSSSTSFYPYQGILFTGTTSTGSGNVIDHNVFLNLGFYAIHKAFTSTSRFVNFTISNNEIYSTAPVCYRAGFVGISLESTSGTSNIFNNKIHDLLPDGNTGTPNITAIAVSNTAGDITNIYNNVIYLDATVNSPIQSWTAINATNAGASNVHYNSIYIGGSSTNTYTARGIVTSSNAIVRNNAVYIARTGSTNTAISGPLAANVSNNCTTNPGFTSPTNLLPDVTNPLSANLDGQGVFVGTVTSDILGNPRNAATPDIGAYEFDLPCTNPTSGGEITAVAEICAGEIPAMLAASAPTGHTGTLQYQWQSSTDNVTFTNIPSATAADYQPDALIVTTYFKRLSRVDCKINWNGAASTNVLTVTVHPVPALTTATTAAVCSGSSPAIALTASVESTFAWTVGTITGGITGTSDGSGTTIDQVLTNTGSAAGTVQYLVTPTSVTGTCAGAPATITVTVNPITNVSVTIIGSNHTCENTAVNYAAFPVNAGSSPTYSWKVDGIEKGTNNTFSYTPVNGEVVTCEVTPDQSVVCPSVSPAVSNAIIMTVDPNTASIEIGTTAASVCSGGSLTFTATPTNEGTTPTYHWKVNGNDAGTNSPQFIYTAPNYTQETIDIITCNLISSSSCASGGAVSSNAVNITVGTSLAPSVSISADLNPVCEGASVKFTASPTNGGNAPSYVWFVNTVAVVGANAFEYSYIPANGDAVTCEMTPDVTGTCIENTTATSNTINMTVNATSASVSIAADLTTVCEGTPVNFTAAPTNGGSSPVYQWKVNTFNAGTNSATFSYSPGIGDVVTCELTSNAPCVASTPVISNMVPITVNPLLTASVTIAASANNVCEGTSVTFTPTPTNGGSSPTYEWFNKGLSVGSGDTYTYAPANGDIITVKMTSNASPCLAGSPATSPEVVMAVNPTLTAGVSITASANPVCAGTSVTFTPVPVNEGTAPTYQWYKNALPVSTESTYTDVPASGDAVYVVMTSNATPCLAGSPATSNTVTMVVNPTLTASVSISASQNNVCHGTEVTFTATPVNGGTLPTYQWWVNNNQGGTGSTYSYVPVNGDNVYVVMTSNATPCLAGSPATSGTITMNVFENARLQASMNGAQLLNNNDGADETQSLTVCNVKTKNLFWQFAENAGITPSTFVKVVENYTLSNVIVNLRDGVFALTAPVSGSTNVRLSNAALPGTLVMRYRVFIDGNNNNLVDNNECAGDWIVYTVTLNPALKAPGAITGSLTIAPNTTQNYSVTADASATSYSWTYSGKGATINPTNGLGNAVAITFGNNATAGTINVKAVNACGESPVTSLKLRLTKSAEIALDPEAEEEVIAKMIAYPIHNIEIRIEGTVEGGAIATLYDLTGRVVANKVLEKGNFNTLPLHGIKTAIYVLSVNDRGKIWTIKVPVRE